MYHKVFRWQSDDFLLERIKGGFMEEVAFELALEEWIGLTYVVIKENSFQEEELAWAER